MPEGDLFATIRAHAVAVLHELHPELSADVLARVQVEPPRDATHGDMATNAAMVAAKPAGVKPAALAAALAVRFAALPEVAEAAPAGPGFVNLRLHDSAWRAVVPAVLRAGEAFADSRIGGGARVNLEYVSANPTGPMHVGHCRGAVVGDALASLLAKAGWDVTREYYVNDAGAQVHALGWAAYWRYLELAGAAVRVQVGDDPVLDVEAVEPATGGRTAATTQIVWTAERVAAEFGVALQYGGDYLVPVGRALFERVGHRWLPVRDDAPRDEAVASATERGWHVARAWIDEARDTAIAMMMESIRADLAALGVRHDAFVSERDVIARGLLEQAEATLAEKNLIYVGMLEPPKGKTPDDWEPREQTLFRATQFGDEVDRPLRKSDGTGTYFANDIANHLGKLERGYRTLLHVWGADHGGYIKRMQAAVAALSDRTATLDVVVTQIVKVVKNGEPVRMSKRAGTYVALADLIDEVGRDAVRFTMLSRKADAQMEFDLDAVVAQTRENPVFYVQYAHARCRSVLRAAHEPTDLADAPLNALEDPAELALIRRLGAWPRTVEAAAQAREPHRIAFFLHDLAADFHLLWNRGREDTTLRFIRDDEPAATRARLALVAATATVIRSGLAVMGVTPVEEMR